MSNLFGKRTYKLHQWCGLLSGILILVLGISGAILVFHEELEAFEFRDSWRVENQDAVKIDAAYRTVTETYKNWEIRLQRFSDNPEETLVFSLRRPDKRLTVFSHPSTGEILEVKDTRKTFVNWVLTLHYSFHANFLGELLVFISGIAYLISLITGLII
jgi:uncharacterized iron-regulated membrane protein